MDRDIVTFTVIVAAETDGAFDPCGGLGRAGDQRLSIRSLATSVDGHSQGFFSFLLFGCHRCRVCLVLCQLAVFFFFFWRMRERQTERALGWANILDGCGVSKGFVVGLSTFGLLSFIDARDRGRGQCEK